MVGTRSSGTGYTSIVGAKVYHRDIGLKVEFFANYTLVNNGYDSLSRVYGIDISAWDWNILSEGVFRGKEESSLSAYGGVKFQLRRSETGDLHTAYLYIRVGSNKAWSVKDVN